MARELPAELLFIIASHLARSDHIVCSTVCKTWRKPFYDLLWDTVLIRRNYLKKYTRRLTKTIKGADGTEKRTVINRAGFSPRLSLPDYDIYGYLVRKLILGDSMKAKKADVHEMQKYFINLRSLVLNNSSIFLSDFERNIQWSAWGRLSSLDIDIPYIAGTKKAQTAIKIVSFLPILNQLTLRNSAYEPNDCFSLDKLEVMHSSLPYLANLKISFPIPPVSMGRFERLLGIEPANSLTTLSLCYEKLDFALLYYCARKYPNIQELSYKALSFKTHPPPTLFTNIEGTGNEPVSNGIYLSKNYQETIVRRLQDLPPFFLNLKSIVLKDRPTIQWQSNVIWEFITNFGIQLENAEYKIKGLIPLRGNTHTPFKNCLDACSRSVKRLHVSCCFNQGGTYVGFLPFNTFPHLVDLIIKLDHNVKIRIDFVLNACPALNLLLVDGDILNLSEEAFDNIEHNLAKQRDRRLVSSRSMSPSAHGLKRLQIGRSFIKSYVLYYISDTCRDLELLELHCVHIYGLILRKELEINMPYTSLKTLVLDYVFFEKLQKGYSESLNPSTDEITHFVIDTIENKVQSFDTKKQGSTRPRPEAMSGFRNLSWVYRPVACIPYPSGGRVWEVREIDPERRYRDFRRDAVEKSTEGDDWPKEIQHMYEYGDDDYRNLIKINKQARQNCASFLFKDVKEYCVCSERLL
ncbi:hypothetical protein CLU79DRAFT_835914 [Phycomyces nitens]|nr:hypothetical protein CLU79DRAFT_835914 [Phycomyces nitens]